MNQIFLNVLVIIEAEILFQSKTLAEFIIRAAVNTMIKLLFVYFYQKCSLALKKHRLASEERHRKKCDVISKIEDAFSEVMRIAFVMDSGTTVGFPTQLKKYTDFDSAILDAYALVRAGKRWLDDSALYCKCLRFLTLCKSSSYITYGRGQVQIRSISKLYEEVMKDLHKSTKR